MLTCWFVADLLLETGPGAARGSIAMAWVTWLAAAIAITLAWGGGSLRRTPAAPGRLPAVVKGIGEVLLGVFLVVLVGKILAFTIPKPPAPAGWSIIRPPQEVSALAVQKDIVWAGGRSGLYAIDRRSGELRRSPAGTLRLRHVKDLLVDRAGALWVAHEEGVLRVLEAGSQVHSFSNPVLALIQRRDGSLWAGTEAGISTFVAGQWKPVEGPGASVFFEDREGRVWAGMDDPRSGGASRYENGQWVAINSLNGICVNSIAQDESGAIWMATGFSSVGALVRWDASALTRWSRRDGIPGGRIRSVFSDRFSRLWIGSEYDGMNVVQVESGGLQPLKLLTPKMGLAGWEVKEMLEDADGTFWLGTENGVSRIVGGLQ